MHALAGLHSLTLAGHNAHAQHACTGPHLTQGRLPREHTVLYCTTQYACSLGRPWVSTVLYPRETRTSSSKIGFLSTFLLHGLFHIRIGSRCWHSMREEDNHRSRHGEPDRTRHHNSSAVAPRNYFFPSTCLVLSVSHHIILSYMYVCVSQLPGSGFVTIITFPFSAAASSTVFFVLVYKLYAP